MVATAESTTYNAIGLHNIHKTPEWQQLEPAFGEKQFFFEQEGAASLRA